MRSNKKAFQSLQKAIDYNDAHAQWQIGKAYYYGESCGKVFEKDEFLPKNYQDAVLMFKKSAEQKHPNGEYWLGVCYYEGRGVQLS